MKLIKRFLLSKDNKNQSHSTRGGSEVMRNSM